MAKIFGSTVFRHGLLVVLAGVGIILLTTSGSDYRNYEYTLLGAYVCATAGLTFLVGGNGQISLGHAALMAIGGYAAGMHLRKVGEERLTEWTDLVAALAIGTVVALVAGFIVGAAAARLRGPYLAGATLAMGVAIHGVTTYFDDQFGGDQGLTIPFPGVPEPLAADVTYFQWQALVSLFSALAMLFLLANLKRSAVGRHMAAVRDNEIAAQLSGLSIRRVQIATFAISAAAAGLGGAVLATAYLQIASPGAFDLVLSLYLLVAVIIGGLGSLRGAVWGSIVIVYLGSFLHDRVQSLGLSEESATRVAENAPLAAFGLLLIVVMLAFPGGIQGALGRLVSVVRLSVNRVGGNS